MRFKNRDDGRLGISRTTIAVAIIVVLVLAGVGIYTASLFFGPSNTTTTLSSNGGPFSSSGSSGGLRVSLSPSSPLISPGETQNYSVIQLQNAGSVPLNGTLTLRAFAPTGISLVLDSDSVSLANDPQSIEFSMSAGSAVSPGMYAFVLETRSATIPASNQTFTIDVVPLLVVMEYPTFYPQNITVAKGTQVTWINLNSNIGCCDPGYHDVGFLSGTNTTSPLLMRLQTWAYTFGSDGVYTYYCTVHPIMTGKVTVTG